MSFLSYGLAVCALLDFGCTSPLKTNPESGSALGVYVGSNLVQQSVIRAIGAPLTALFLGVRLISACFGSYWLLGEAIRSPIEWLGLIM